MGGERFETTQPEAFLFGENQDLNFLGSRPIPVSFWCFQPSSCFDRIYADSFKFYALKL